MKRKELMATMNGEQIVDYLGLNFLDCDFCNCAKECQALDGTTEQCKQEWAKWLEQEVSK